MGKHTQRVALEIIASFGGDEAYVAVKLLHDMYYALAQRKKWAIVEVNIVEAYVEEGLIHVVWVVSGEKAQQYLQYESGIHRMIRVPPQDLDQRLHMSFAQVNIFSLKEGITIPENELVITPEASQEAKIKLEHTPTGIAVRAYRSLGE
ncbi:MAG: PCRF domain-containing protein [Thermonemataceae bacterium]